MIPVTRISDIHIPRPFRIGSPCKSALLLMNDLLKFTFLPCGSLLRRAGALSTSPDI